MPDSPTSYGLDLHSTMILEDHQVPVALRRLHNAALGRVLLYKNTIITERPYLL